MLNRDWKISPGITSYIWKWIYRTNSSLTERHLILYANDRTIRIGRHHQTIDDNVLQIKRGLNNSAPYLYFHPFEAIACQCSKVYSKITFMNFKFIMPRADRDKWSANYRNQQIRKKIEVVKKQVLI